MATMVSSMMRLRTMDLLVRYTDRGEVPPLVEEALSRWAHDVGTLRYVRSSANHVFRFEHQGRPRYLRLAHESERAAEQIRGELAFIEHAAAQGVRAARPLSSLSDERIEVVGAGPDRYYAVVFAGLEGQQWLGAEDLSPDMVREWGRVVGRVHRASRSFSIPEGAFVPSWEEELAFARRWMPPIEDAALAALAEAETWLRGLPDGPEAYGVIHRDLELDNLVWDGETFQVLDFDGVRRHWYDADVAWAIEEAWEVEGPEREARLGWFLEGYGEVVPRRVAVEAIPRVLRLGEAQSVGEHYYWFDGLTPECDPDWVGGLRARLEGCLAAVRAAL
jgi:Ser/Thr protein kinase RdoA (MazF antagonist)